MPVKIIEDVNKIRCNTIVLYSSYQDNNDLDYYYINNSYDVNYIKDRLAAPRLNMKYQFHIDIETVQAEFKEIKNNFISEKEEKLNIENFKKILPFFFYNKKTYKHINSFLNNKAENKLYFLNNYLSLEKDHRKFYEAKVDIQEENYRKYIEMIFFRLGNIYKKKHLLVKYTSFIDLLKILLSYDTFVNRRVIVEKQTFKLIKFLGKVLPNHDIEHLNNIFNLISKDNIITICVSRNPVDYLFVSTGQSFSSCVSLESGYSSAYYMGLGGLCIDPNRFLIFQAKDMKDYSIKSSTFNIFKYISRSFCFALNECNENNILEKINQDKIFIFSSRFYPRKSEELNVFLRTIYNDRYITNNENTSKAFKSLFNFYNPRHINQTLAGSYLDNIGFGVHSADNCFYYKNIFSTYANNKKARFFGEGWASRFRWEDGFEHIKSFNEIKRRKLRRW